MPFARYFCFLRLSILSQHPLRHWNKTTQLWSCILAWSLTLLATTVRHTPPDCNVNTSSAFATLPIAAPSFQTTSTSRIECTRLIPSFMARPWWQLVASNVRACSVRERQGGRVHLAYTCDERGLHEYSADPVGDITRAISPTTMHRR